MKSTLSEFRPLAGLERLAASEAAKSNRRSLGSARDDTLKGVWSYDCYLLQQGALFFVAVAVQFFGRDDDGGGYLVVGLEVEDADALRGAAG